MNATNFDRAAASTESATAPQGIDPTHALIGLAVPLASFLSFVIQPLVGKLLLPSQGGSAATWLAVMVFFQFALMLGYGLATWLTRRRIEFQVTVMISLAAVSVLATQLPSIWLPPSHGFGGILLGLTVSLVPAMTLLFAIPPLLHGWWMRNTEVVPYHVYSLSNAGSLGAVVLYPFVFEMNLGITAQSLWWRGLLVALSAVLGITGLILRRRGDDAGRQSELPPLAAEPGLWRRFPRWASLSALTCVAMLAATQQIAAEIGSAPVAWVGPFGIYLLSFSVTFTGAWKRWMSQTSVAVLAVGLSAYMITKGVAPTPTTGPSLLWLLVVTGAGSFVGNALLFEMRPSRRFEIYYLALAAGGVAGGLICAVVLPAILSRPLELSVSAGMLLFLGLLQLIEHRTGLRLVVAACVVGAPLAAVAWKQGVEVRGPDEVDFYRNIYGCAMIRRETGGGVVLSNETTTHGSQLTADEASRKRPTLYYTESSAVGRALLELQRERTSLRVGIVGLGAGTLSAYARPTDRFEFWDIDPKAIALAGDAFSFLADAGSSVSVHLKDGRKGLEESRHDFDVIVIDAFSGDSIPAHLLTQEALDTYAQRLNARQGVLLVHASNRYSDVFPVLHATAATCGWRAFDVSTEISSVGEMKDWDAATTQYVVLCFPSSAERVQSWYPLEEEAGRVKRTLRIAPDHPRRAPRPWSDDRNSMLDTLGVARFLWPES